MGLKPLADTLTLVLFLVGAALVIASWTGRAGSRIGWSGAWLAIAALIGSWVPRAGTTLVVLAAGAAAVLVLRLLPARSRQAFGRSKRGEFRPWDQEAELLRLCHGDKAMAERLIQHEMARNPALSRAGAALSAATRLRMDR